MGNWYFNKEGLNILCNLFVRFALSIFILIAYGSCTKFSKDVDQKVIKIDGLSITVPKHAVLDSLNENEQILKIKNINIYIQRGYMSSYFFDEILQDTTITIYDSYNNKYIKSIFFSSINYNIGFTFMDLKDSLFSGEYKTINISCSNHNSTQLNQSLNVFKTIYHEKNSKK